MPFFPKFTCSSFLCNKCSLKSCMHTLVAMLHILSPCMPINVAVWKSNPATCCLAQWFGCCWPIRLQPELCWYRKRTWALTLLGCALLGLANATCKSLCFPFCWHYWQQNMSATPPCWQFVALISAYPVSQRHSLSFYCSTYSCCCSYISFRCWPRIAQNHKIFYLKLSSCSSFCIDCKNILKTFSNICVTALCCKPSSVRKLISLSLNTANSARINTYYYI